MSADVRIPFYLDLQTDATAGAGPAVGMPDLGTHERLVTTEIDDTTAERSASPFSIGYGAIA